MSDTATILRKARDHIAQPGMWWQGNFFPDFDDDEPTPPPDDAPCCPFGAVAWALFCSPSGPINDADRMLIKALRLEGKEYVPDWNDAPGRTQAEVVALFDRAIELAEREDAA